MSKSRAESRLPTITVRAIAEAPVMAGQEAQGPFLAGPDRRGAWAFVGWDGERWFDVFSGELLQPAVLAELPSVALFTDASATAGGDPPSG